MRRIVVALGLLLAFAAPAQAVEVARDGDFVLRARSDGGRVCLSLNGLVRSRCRPAPGSPFHPVFVSVYEGRGPIAAAVAPRVASATVEGRRVDTIAVDGFRSRFLLVAGPAPDALIRFYDESGELVGAARNEELAFERRGGRELLLSRAGVRVRGRRDFELRPDPLELDRTVATSCLSFSVGSGTSSSCRPDTGALPLDVNVDRRCAPRDGIISGAVSDEIRRLDVVLGSGRTRSFPAVAVPEPFTGHFRLVAARIPRGEAVRRIRAVGADGRTVATRRVAAAPAGPPCEDDGIVSAFGYADFGLSKATARGVVVGRAGSKRLFAVDGADRSLCVGFAARPRCGSAPVDSEGFLLARSGGSVGGVVAADVASVTFIRRDGPPVTVDTTEGPLYSGRYAGHVRFVTATLGRERSISRAVARDAEGHRLGTGYVEPFAAPDPDPERNRLRVGPGVFVERSAISFGPSDHFLCLSAGKQPAFALFLGCAGLFGGETYAQGKATCKPRRLVLFGFMPKGVRDVHLALSGRRRLDADITRLPGRFDHKRVWVAQPGREVGVRAIVFSEPPPRPYPGASQPDRREELTLPPVAEQCGYDLNS